MKSVLAVENISAIRARIAELESEILAIDDNQQERLENFYKNLDAKLSDLNPQILLYGLYNAGKSTLINALFGKEVAEVGDKPQTKAIEEYRFNNHIIFDSPGVNAPQEHEEITKEHYKTCEVILFVMSNENVDTSEAYSRIKNIADDNKPIIIVLNKKQEISDEVLKTQINHIYNNVAKLNIEAQIPIVAINAQSALKAKLENKPKLLESSNIKELEFRISEILEQNGKNSVINVCEKMIDEFLQNTLIAIDENIGDNTLQKLQSLITNYSNMKQNLQDELESHIKLESAKLAQDFEKALLSKKGELEFESIINKYSEKISNDINQKLQASAEEMDKMLNKVSIEIGHVDTDTTIEKSMVGDVAKIATLIAPLIKLIPHPIAKIAALVLTPVAALCAFLFGDSKEDLEQARRAKCYDCAISAKMHFIAQAQNSLKESLDLLFNPTIKTLQDSISRNSQLDDLKNKILEIREIA